MTKSEIGAKKRNYINDALNLILLSLTVLFSVTLSPKISFFVKEGLTLCFEAIIGSVFPFMIITDAISQSLKFEDSYTLKKLFERLFKINGRAVSAFILGAVCGFPVGVKLAADMYKRGVINKDECERLIGFSSNMGPAFIISGVGAALCGSVTTGIILYAVALISAAISGAVLGLQKNPSSISSSSKNSVFSLTDSIKSATKSTVTICGFIIFFSAVCGVLSILVKNDFLCALTLPFFEISNATKKISALSFIPKNTKLIIIAFSVSFSGLSIYMQAKSFFEKAEISMKPYLEAKLLSGIISAFIMAVLTLAI